jgi:rhomboid protease GluP
MANCITCGRPLPAFTFGARSDVCANCRASAIDVPTGSPGQPAAAQVALVRGKAPVTRALVGINVAVFVGMALSGVSLSEPTVGQLLKWGANFGPLSLGPQPWRMLTSNYLHIGLLHILFNMWCLWDLGNLAERIFDRWTYVLTYTVCGLAGSLGSLWWHPLVIGAGASGAIFGLAGALIAALYLGKLPIPKQAVQRTLRSLMMFAGYNLFFGAVGAGVDNSAHLGGLAVGLVLGAVLAKQLTQAEEVRKRWRTGVFVIAALALLIAFTWVRQANGHLTPAEQSMNILPVNILPGRKSL